MEIIIRYFKNHVEFFYFFKYFKIYQDCHAQSNEFRRLSNLIGLALGKNRFPSNRKKAEDKNISRVTSLSPQGSPTMQGSDAQWGRQSP